MAAGFAYRGHWKSVAAADEVARIRQIEEEEWHRRTLVAQMLAALGERPSRLAEARAWVTGRVLGLLCHVSGWLLPMYGAGRLESRNVREYESAARDALIAGHEPWVDCLLTMAEVEWAHESYFRERVRSHRLGARLPLWPQPPPKPEIRASFEREMRRAQAPTPARLPPSQLAPERSAPT
ncbi:MAG: hypothetical protein EXS13_10760 [Planctomycetes bacterium]|nr:hypothetical protein [Planctomycetota bacterium]